MSTIILKLLQQIFQAILPVIPICVALITGYLVYSNDKKKILNQKKLEQYNECLSHLRSWLSLFFSQDGKKSEKVAKCAVEVADKFSQLSLIGSYDVISSHAEFRSALTCIKDGETAEEKVARVCRSLGKLINAMRSDLGHKSIDDAWLGKEFWRIKD